MTNLSNIKLFVTHPHDCSYLEDEQSTTLFVDPATQVNLDLYSQLSEHGFRRSGDHLYRPNCQHCHACIPIRIPLEQFTPSRNQARCLKNNADLSLEDVNDISGEEFYLLYDRYIRMRHADGDMYPPSRKQYEAFLTNEWGATHFLAFRKDDQLIALAVTDVLNNAASAIYTFFDPALEKRSLGKLCILRQIQWAQDLGLQHLYLGYWIKKCQKMAYKIDYRPFQLLLNKHWVSISEE